MKFFGLLLLLLSSTSSFGFNRHKCSNSFPGSRGYGWQYSSLATLFGLSTSSAEFISSTGNCAAFGSLEDKRNHYYSYNFESIQTEIAKGGGEYLDNLLSLFGCEVDKKRTLINKFKSEYSLNFKSYSQDSKIKIFKSTQEFCALSAGQKQA